MKPIAFWRDETGAVLVEISILLPICLMPLTSLREASARGCR